MTVNKADKKSILLIGDGNHQLITNFILWLHRQTEAGFQIDILSFTIVKEANRKYYTRVFNIDKNTITDVINKVKGLRRFYRFHQYKTVIKALPCYDVIHFHFINPDTHFLIQQFRKYTQSRIILSIWGSDMYRVKPANENRFLKSCKEADCITFTNQKSVEFFQSKYQWPQVPYKLCRFGLAPLEHLKKLEATSEECKKKLSWNPNKLAIAIGYNLSPFQQHLEILKQFENKELIALKDKIQLILPVTYGGLPEYKKQLLGKLDQLPFEYFVYDTFLCDEEIAQIRKASDIMIQLQKTDQFSGSMQEHLFARNVVITGKWLPYETLKEYGAWFIEIDRISELVNILAEVINDYKKFQVQTINNPQAILELSSWQKNIKDWIALYA